MARKPMEPGRPYWLFKEPGKDHGFHTVPFELAASSDAARDLFWDEIGEFMREQFRLYSQDKDYFVVELVVLSYQDGQPVVTPVQ